MIRYLRSRRICLLLLSFVLVLAVHSVSFAEDLFLWPVQGKVIAEYGYAPYQKAGHRGIDIEAAEGAPVKAAAAGRVYWTGSGPEGPGVGIEHSDGLRTTYMPVEKSVRLGQIIGRGDVVGKVRRGAGATTAYATHLHFGVKKPPYGEEDYLDPRGFLPLALAQDAKQMPNPDLSPARLMSQNGSSDVGNAETAPTGLALNPKPASAPIDQTKTVHQSIAPQAESQMRPAEMPAESGVDSREALKQGDTAAVQNARATLGAASTPEAAVASRAGKGSDPMAEMLSPPALLQDVGLVKPASADSSKGDFAAVRRGARAGQGLMPACSDHAEGFWSILLLALAGCLVLSFGARKAIQRSAGLRVLRQPAFGVGL